MFSFNKILRFTLKIYDMKIQYKKISIKALAILSLLIASFACSEEFLEIEPQGNVLPEDFFSSPEAANELVVAVYDQLSEWTTSSFSWIGISSITSDNADKGSDPGDTGTDKDLLDEWTFGSDAISFDEIWSSHYNGIARANQAIDILPKLDVDEELKNKLEGEVKFLRAFYYFNLVRCFGGVPLMTKPDIITEEDLINGRTRAKAEDIYALIVTDLEFAIDVLPSVSEQDDSELGHANLEASKTFLAKVSMYLENWDEVYRLTNEVIGSNNYALLDDYSHIWREIGENSEESIFEIQARGVTPMEAITMYSEVQSVRGQLGWGFNTPSKDLEDTYEEGDVRRDATIIYEGEVMWDSLQIIPDAPNPRYNQKAYVSTTHETYESLGQANKNIRIFRYAEVLLMNAEAANEINEPTIALASLNMVRERAQIDDITTTDQNDLRNAIWNERRLELAMEHDRVFDLRRQGRAGEVLRAHGKSYIDGKHDLFPIPLTQIDLSGGLLEQNPGY